MPTTIIRRTLTYGFSALALSACSGAGGDPSPSDVPQGVVAEPIASSEAAGPARPHRDPAEFVKRFDKNGDGKLQISELPERMQAWMGKADTDHDGILSVAELTAQREAFMKKHFARLDKSGDGAVTKDEVGDRRWARISVADADGNGSVTFAEMQAALAAGKLRFPGHHHHMDRESDAPAPAPVGS